jgi:hypothetical protein
MVAMKLTIDTSGCTFFVTRAPEPKTAFETGAARMDRESGLPLFAVQLAVLDGSGGEVLNVTVAGAPQVSVGSPVAVEGLVAIPWAQGERSGVAYRAASIRSTGAPIAGVITAVASAERHGSVPPVSKPAA